jgi:4-hydroxyphenylpyruvate dioxygenase
MDIDHIRFYVEDAIAWREWFVKTMGFRSIAAQVDPETHTEIISNGAVSFVLSAPRTSTSAIAQYLQHHPPGVADVALRVTALEAVLERVRSSQGQVLQSMQVEERPDGYLKWAIVSGWGDLHHTLVERVGAVPLLPGLKSTATRPKGFAETLGTPSAIYFKGIDHAVLNVAQGDLSRAIAWYETVLGFQRQQQFAIQTERSGLLSQVLIHPAGTAQLPINEPDSPQSQIQEFLEANRGSGVQHIALQTVDIVRTIACLRKRGLAFLPVPFEYYERLQQRIGFQVSEERLWAIAAQKILIDWQFETPEALLLQAFTQPLFAQPTFFFELIERQGYWLGHQYRQVEGFGEGNFQALFEAIEREQKRRGRL